MSRRVLLILSGRTWRVVEPVTVFRFKHFHKPTAILTIETSLLDAGDTQPTTASTTRMYGQADISFVAGGTGGNQNPVITTTAITTATENTAYAYDVDATDADGDTLTYSLTTGPTGMTINASSGLINWTPGTSDVGTHAGNNNGNRRQWWFGRAELYTNGIGRGR